ncbi:4Fe-4S dicluster domain-containing protein [Acerihabitans arboris]|uniref:4Fe-4S dicluster domain-containing protein n=1 Tax=Acerihabitans arboris TaxID=2691583 RepID=A0A845SJ45_9GAMM|nr:4Fe-4S dicluster domain-containing protein [Acerihabitans arboris]NDL63277.1 4Fe-4S dicluster domain-containing protein [Acerihabitans arboris]
MSCSRRSFIRGIGGAILVTYPVHRFLAGTLSRQTIVIDNVRYGMLHDETRCIGCKACVVACHNINNVPAGVTRVDIVDNGTWQDQGKTQKQFARKSCQHCDNPPCVEVCPTGASYKDAKTGIVDVDANRCVGCRYCLAACPYHVRFIHPVTKTADKCNFCRDTNLAKGRLPACVAVCPTKALTFGNLDDPDSEIAKAIAGRTVYRSKIHLGTAPKLYHIPGKFGEIPQ